MSDIDFFQGYTHSRGWIGRRWLAVGGGVEQQLSSFCSPGKSVRTFHSFCNAKTTNVSERGTTSQWGQSLTNENS